MPIGDMTRCGRCKALFLAERRDPPPGAEEVWKRLSARLENLPWCHECFAQAIREFNARPQPSINKR